MADCQDRPVYRVVQPVRYGAPSIRVFKPLVRINGLMQDAPEGYKIATCYLPDVIETAAGDAPETVPYVAPTNVFGATPTTLGTPDAWGSVTIAGVPYVYPLYAVAP